MTKEIPLRNSAEVALVSDEDYEWLSQYKWYYTGKGYAQTAIWDREAKKQRRPLMHRMILGLERGDKRLSDHVNREKLDNRRENLRIVNSRQSLRNRRKFRTYNGKPTASSEKFVYYDNGRDAWRVQFQLWTADDEILAIEISRWLQAKLLGEHGELLFWQETGRTPPE